VIETGNGRQKCWKKYPVLSERELKKSLFSDQTHYFGKDEPQ